MDWLAITKGINDILWGNLLIFLLCGAGIIFTLTLRFVQVRKFKEGVNKLFGDLTLFGEKAGNDGMSSFQALATAIAAQVGTGNLAGAATAIASGGPGAIFWMWLAAFLGMATIFVEAVLAQKYKQTVDGQVTGGPAYYLSKGLGSKFLAGFFSVAIILALGFIGNAVQANSIATAFSGVFPISNIAVGGILAVVAGLIFIGGIGRIASVVEKVVPIMALFYIVGGLYVILANVSNLIPALRMIFVGAFNSRAATGGLIGVSVKEVVRYGVARGLFSNEAGMGSTPHAHAVAKVKHPAEQGLVAIVSVFIDTFVVLNITAFVILTTGALDGQTTGIALTQKAFSLGMGNIGNYFVAITLLFFAFSTIIGWYFFGEANALYLFGKKALRPYQLLVLGFILYGTTQEVPLVWELADLFNGLMVIPNLIGLLGLMTTAKAILEDYESSQKLSHSQDKAMV
jgi:AGCS family alanine or glycine:cation symporter